ncbi:MAG: FAD-dependent oxidoreductase, partial [Gammaproteobacteria bacterium]|nr:FAD-dependent oxidoreductase [Gammaproteobacteria bacterium]
VLQGRGGEALLASYEPERIEFARTLVATTDRAFHLVTAQGRVADLVRTRIAPSVLSELVKLRYVRHLMFKTVSQTTLNYRSSPLCQGRAGSVSGGDRLPWTGGIDGAVDNFSDAAELRWKIHVYGRASDELSAWCEAHDVPLEVFAWQDGFGRIGLQRDALYLLRPDSYVGLAQPVLDLPALERYGAERGLSLGG